MADISDESQCDSAMALVGVSFSIAFTCGLEHSSPSALNGRLLSIMGLIAYLLQGTIVRRTSTRGNLTPCLVVLSTCVGLLAYGFV